MSQNYKVLSSLGSGAFGTTYRAERLSDGRIVVIKMPNAEASQAVDRARLSGIVQASLDLDHRGIAGWIETIELEGRAALVSEYVDGVDLSTLVHATSGIEARPALQIVGRLAAILADAAELGQIHGDLKPTNVVLTEVGVVQLVDFGLALCDRRPVNDDHTAFFDRQDYMSPERVGGCEESTAADVFALGRVLYELLTGQRPVRISPNPGRATTNRELHLGRLRAVVGEGQEDLVRLFSDTQAFEPAARPSPAEIADRCTGLVDDAQGRSLGSWTRRVLPDILASRQEFPLVESIGSLAGEVVGEAGVSGPAEAPSPRRAPQAGITERTLIGVGATSFVLSMLIAVAILWKLTG